MKVWGSWKVNLRSHNNHVSDFFNWGFRLLIFNWGFRLLIFEIKQTKMSIILLCLLIKFTKSNAALKTCVILSFIIWRLWHLHHHYMPICGKQTRHCALSYNLQFVLNFRIWPNLVKCYIYRRSMYIHHPVKNMTEYLYYFLTCWLCYQWVLD